MNMRYVAPLVALVIAVAVGVYTLRPSPGEFAGATMGTTWSVRVSGGADSGLRDAIQARLDKLDAEMSTWRADSAISRFNDSRSGEWFSVSPDFAAVVAEAQRVAAVSGGAFDITVLPLIELWAPGKKAEPTQAEIDTTLRHVGYRKLDVRANPPGLRKLDPEVRIDLSALGSGYAAGKIAELLEAAGVHDYLVNVGGTLCAAGHGDLGRGWHVGVEAPLPGVRLVQRRVVLESGGLSTSGDYRQIVERGGRRHSHFIDPMTGRPVDGPLASVTVVDRSPITADAMDTALMVMGLDRGLAVARALNVPAMFIVRHGEGLEERMTGGFEKLLIKPE